MNERENLVPVRRENGEQVSDDPRRLHGVTLYRETERAFSEGDRVVFRAPNREQHIANRELGTIEKMDSSRNIQVHLDSGRAVSFNIVESLFCRVKRTVKRNANGLLRLKNRNAQ